MEYSLNPLLAVVLGLGKGGTGGHGAQDQCVWRDSGGEAAPQVGLGVRGPTVAEASHPVGGLLHRRTEVKNHDLLEL